MTGKSPIKGDKAPIQAGQRWHVERTNAWHNGFNRLQRCYERNEDVINSFFDPADAIITVRRLIREAWILYRVGRPPGQASVITHLSARSLTRERPYSWSSSGCGGSKARTDWSPSTRTQAAHSASSGNEETGWPGPPNGSVPASIVRVRVSHPRAVSRPRRWL